MADKALLIGINEYEYVSPLRGCVNDVADMEALLKGELGFTEVVKLTDADARKAEVKKQMKWLMDGAKAGDRLVFHFAGHGSYTADDDADEGGGADELLCLVNMTFDNKNTYLTDDELGEWTKKLPAGVKLLVVLDCCHSGTGTRAALAPTGGPQRLVVESDTNQRFAESSRSAGGLRATALMNPDSEPMVLARYVEPPEHIAKRVAARARKAGRVRALVPVDMNHVLLAACRDDQTAADAHIGGDFHGAFTYHLCRAVKAAGPRADRTNIHRLVERALKDGRFAQVPQFEGPDEEADLFGGTPAEGGRTQPKQKRKGAVEVDSPGQAGWIQSALQKVLASDAPLGADDRRTVLDIIRRLLDTGGTTGGRSAGGRKLVCVHGISRHEDGYSDDWWDALRPHVGDLYGDGGLGGRRVEVNWSNLVNRSLTASASSSSTAEVERLKREIADVVHDRVDRVAAVAAAADRGFAEVAATRAAGSRGIFDGLGWDDFLIYMTNDDMRRRIVERFTDKVGQLFRDGIEFDIISHSWGTVVAYEGLRELEDKGLTAQRVRTLFTVGAALSIPPVRWRLRDANKDGRKPANVARWVNVDAAGDGVGGELGRHFRVDDEFLELPPVGCQKGLFGWFDLGCAHGSYFREENVKVNRDIFARFATGG